VGRTRSTAALLATAVASAVLVGAAFATVAGAGCADPGRLVTRADGSTVLVGGCVAATDLVVPGAPLPPEQQGPATGDVLRP
jgi:hypothetical protein